MSLTRFVVLFLALLTYSQTAFAAETGAPGVICDFIMFVNGRYMRAIAILTIMSMSFAAFNGSIKWQVVLVTIVALVMITKAKLLATVILESKIKNVSGRIGNKTFYREETYTPDEIISAACPQL